MKKIAFDSLGSFTWKRWLIFFICIFFLMLLVDALFIVKHLRGVFDAGSLLPKSVFAAIFALIGAIGRERRSGDIKRI